MDNLNKNIPNTSNIKDINSNGKNIVLNKIKNRLLMLSPTVQAGLEAECTKADFYRHGEKAIGKGGFGEVWKVVHKSTKKTYAVKVIDKKYIVEQNMVNQINREIEIMYKVNHPHIIKLINHFEDEENFYLIMNYASKGQLYTYLKKYNRFDQRLSAQYMREVSEAVKYLHSFNPPIIHRDIKPENLLLDENGRIKLADFGWSNFKGSNQRDTFCGTPDYLSPEMVKKQGHDTSVDIWSLGVLLFEFLSGHAPFTGINQEELFMNIRRLKINWPNDFPPLAKNLITRILKLNPKERITIDEILAHSWFEKNPPIKPIVINLISDPKLILESHLICVTPENVTDQLNDVVNDIKLKVSVISKNKNNQVMTLPAPTEELKEIATQKNSQIEKLIKENSDLRKKCEKYESENTKFKEIVVDQKKAEEMQKVNEELEKYRIINKDRLDLLSELEDKNNEIFDLKNKIKEYESENKNLSQNFEKFKLKIAQNEQQLENYESKIKELRLKINDLMKEKEDAIMNYQKKLDILQFKVLDSNNDDQNESSITKVLEVLDDSINDMKTIFTNKVSNLNTIIFELNEDNKKMVKELSDVLNEKSGQISEIFLKFKNSVEDELNKANIKVRKESNASKINQMVDWLKKQINELQPFKNKSMFLENKISNLEATISLLQNKLQSSDSKVENLEKIIVLKNEKIDDGKAYIEKIEAKLSDVKDFVFKNCTDQLDSFNNTFNNY